MRSFSSPDRIAKRLCAICTLLGLTALSGCAALLSPAIYSVVKDQNVQLHDGQGISARAPYKVTWTTKLGTSGSHKNYAAPLVTIATGNYRDWSWKVRGSAPVVTSWRIWLKHGAKTSISTASNGQPVILNWQYGFKTLWKITDYMLGQNPLPMQLKLTLIPDNRAFEAVVTKSDSNKVPVVLSAWYPATTKITAAAAQKRFHYYAESLAMVGGLLERVELARGVTAAPPHGKGRIIKDRANAFCWRLAGRPAIAAGTDYKLKTRGVGSTAGRLTARIYHRHPKDMLAQELYAVALALHKGSEYLSVEGLKMPRNGKDLRAINALLGFCRALVHYPGDIRKKPMPLLNITPAHFFPIPAATSAAQAATSKATASR